MALNARRNLAQHSNEANKVVDQVVDQDVAIEKVAELYELLAELNPPGPARGQSSPAAGREWPPTGCSSRVIVDWKLATVVALFCAGGREECVAAVQVNGAALEEAPQPKLTKPGDSSCETSYGRLMGLGYIQERKENVGIAGQKGDRRKSIHCT